MDNQDIRHQQSRLEGTPPHWVPIRGLTLLLDTPDVCLVADEANGLRRLHCDVSREAKLALFNILYGGVADSEIIRLFAGKQNFCIVPSAAYHVTALGLFSEENVHLLSARVRNAAVACLREQPGCERREFQELIDCIMESGLVTQQFSVEYEYDSFALFSTALVARLRPTLVSLEAHQSLEHARNALSSQLHERFGLPISAKLDPHVTIGYFTSLEERESFSPFLEHIQAVGSGIRSRVSFSSVSLYSYSDVTHFFRVPLP